MKKSTLKESNSSLSVLHVLSNFINPFKDAYVLFKYNVFMMVFMQLLLDPLKDVLLILKTVTKLIIHSLA